MLTAVLAHAGTAVAPHDLWRAWDLDPLVVGGLVLAVWLHHRGHGRGRRATWFLAGVTAVAVALVSPLDAMSGALASAHMVQHLLLVLVAAPLLAMSAPAVPLLRGSPRIARRAVGRSQRWLQRNGVDPRSLLHPVAVSVLHVAAIWTWHAAAPYDAALRSDLWHVVEHASFLVTGVLFWRVVVGGRAAARVPNGAGVVLVFAMAMQSVVLSLLLTFARTPWYEGYSTTTAAWGLDPLADQQLAGVIMWVPAGLVYLGVALALLTSWLNGTEPARVPAGGPLPGRAHRSDRSDRADRSLRTGGASGVRTRTAPGVPGAGRAP